MVVMIDPGATYNFISTTSTQHLQILITESKSFGVTLGTSEVVQGEGVCSGVILEVQGAYYFIGFSYTCFREPRHHIGHRDDNRLHPNPDETRILRGGFKSGPNPPGLNKLDQDPLGLVGLGSNGFYN